MPAPTSPATGRYSSSGPRAPLDGLNDSEHRPRAHGIYGVDRRQRLGGASELAGHAAAAKSPARVEDGVTVIDRDPALFAYRLVPWPPNYLRLFFAKCTKKAKFPNEPENLQPH